jgi:hypothetical protein
MWMTQTPFLGNLVISLPLMNGVGRDDVDEALSEAVLLETFGLGDAEG